jgi:hypothetical protein
MTMPKTPEIGEIVEYGTDSFGKKPARYRVQSYLCEATPSPRPIGNNTLDVIIDEILAEEAVNRPSRKRLRWCLEEEATHVSLVGTAGTIAPIDKCKPVGMVPWSAALLEEAKRHAYQLGMSKQPLY